MFFALFYSFLSCTLSSNSFYSSISFWMESSENHSSTERLPQLLSSLFNYEFLLSYSVMLLIKSSLEVSFSLYLAPEFSLILAKVKDLPINLFANPPEVYWILFSLSVFFGLPFYIKSFCEIYTDSVFSNCCCWTLRILDFLPELKSRFYFFILITFCFIFFLMDFIISFFLYSFIIFDLITFLVESLTTLNLTSGLRFIILKVLLSWR